MTVRDWANRGQTYVNARAPNLLGRFRSTDDEDENNPSTELATDTTSAYGSTAASVVTMANSKPDDVSLYATSSHHHEYFTGSAWIHPVYTKEQMDALEVNHRKTETFSDRVALRAILLMRIIFDLCTGYKHPKEGEAHLPKFRMTTRQWLDRFLFLESIAGVPGMVAGMIRHLHSLRALRRDRAWIESLVEEAYNERMHLLTFLKLQKPSVQMRTGLLIGQIIFYNLFFISYLISPATCHRFVGYLEEEAVITYTRCLEDIDAGRLPELASMEVPDIARTYWHMEDDCTMRDLIQYVRADEAKHCEVNHTFGNLHQTSDRNPFALVIDNGRPQPSKDLTTFRSVGWRRDEIAN
ncbi:YALI0E00814p [Yarrowia lipolytica CLIB122]|uniref:Alternative oxidase, mitochondrial n=2 Tax=Yarrowia lipolytica TaxID=4952 RepID=AOX_YARLI|nr:YALI0E00814p [Yarrowia lipolytica CLIB122]Q8J0I8.1 RecName: Full=Alternative oxidase, mitochondrial; Flags: Precursor [Yarrowia lipolytica CLIB122]AOW04778.1 hypothetical protein YALI1_E01213g [Yarrowia lipolytica]KAB8282832.1 mitochondrial alternative oxidase [Yarrowia lipolytica]KAE8174555.1 mitochondrial alternative oxidase [Yarrowia lipolytica]KAJ8056361.1 mitochondrial alternative oxidase [Yarrowia lipolytica]RMI97998.1 mitochondrial alternative oxidase [Yarrowia lipolytica]|eukprot:XP_503388.1 YALI0E00814p [Yarrowia lipolytica CLIB122]